MNVRRLLGAALTMACGSAAGAAIVLCLQGGLTGKSAAAREATRVEPAAAAPAPPQIVYVTAPAAAPSAESPPAAAPAPSSSASRPADVRETQRAATAEYYPTFDIEGDYGDIGVNPANSNGTFHVGGTITVPVFQGGKVHADTLQAEATLRQTKARLEDLRGQIDNDVRSALLDLNAASDQVTVALSNVDLAEQTLVQAQDRFSAGVTDNLEVVQAQESVASAHENLISSLYARNLAKVEFARSVGHAEQGVKQYLKGQ